MRHLAQHPEAYLHRAAEVPAADPARERAQKDVARLEAQLNRYRADYGRGLLEAEEYALLRDEAKQALELSQAAAATVPMPVTRDPSVSLELIADLVAQGMGWREVLMRSGTRLKVSTNGLMDIELRV